MPFLPADPDELIAVLIVLAVAGAMALVAAGRLVLWVAGWEIWRRRAVNHSARPAADYVAPAAVAPPPARPFRQEPEPEPEPAGLAELPEPTGAPAGKLYSAEQIATIEERAREAGAARALGALLGAGLVDESSRSAAMELLFGKRGRAWQRVRPQVEESRAAVATPPEEARLVPVNGGDRGHVEL